MKLTSFCNFFYVGDISLENIVFSRDMLRYNEIYRKGLSENEICFNTIETTHRILYLEHK